MSKMSELEYEQRMAADQPPSEDTPGSLSNQQQFNHWWNEGETGETAPGANPYRHESAAYWAWEGWQAAIRARGQG